MQVVNNILDSLLRQFQLCAAFFLWDIYQLRTYAASQNNSRIVAQALFGKNSQNAIVLKSNTYNVQLSKSWQFWFICTATSRLYTKLPKRDNIFDTFLDKTNDFEAMQCQLHEYSICILIQCCHNTPWRRLGSLWSMEKITQILSYSLANLTGNLNQYKTSRYTPKMIVNKIVHVSCATSPLTRYQIQTAIFHASCNTAHKQSYWHAVLVCQMPYCCRLCRDYPYNYTVL